MVCTSTSFSCNDKMNKHTEYKEQFIGRGEKLTKQLLLNPFDIVAIHSQVELRTWMTKEELDFYDEEIKQHKSDFIILRSKDILALEVNYMHGPKADKKSNKIFEPFLKSHGITLVTLDDNSSRKIFNKNSKGNHKITTDDIRDVLDAFDKARVKI